MAAPTRILLLEDDPHDAELLGLHLARAGLELDIVHVESVPAFLEALASRTFDLVLSDYRLRASDGIEALRGARKLRPDVPFIFVSGSIGEERAIETLKEGATDYVLKDRLGRLAPSIRRALRERDEQLRLRRAEEERDSFYALSTDMFSIAGFDGFVKDMNPAGTAVLGWSLDEARSRPWIEFFHPDDRDVARHQMIRLVRGELTQQLERRMTCRDGSTKWIHWSAAVDRERELVLCAGRDVTERRRMEVELRARASQQTAIAELGRTAVGARDLGALFHAIVTTLPERLDCDACRVLMLTPPEKYVSIAQSGPWHDSVGDEVDDPGAQRTVESARTFVLDDETVPDWTHARAHGFGSAMWVVLRGDSGPFGAIVVAARRERAFSRPEARFLEAVATLASIAIRRRESEEALRTSEQHLRHAQKMEAVGQLAGGIAHDFNNLLTAILGYAESTRTTLEADHPCARDVREIERVAHRAAGLTRRLLAFSRTQLPSTTSIDLNAIVAGMQSMLEIVLGPGIELQVDLDPRVWSARADAGQIEQSILNLAINARDAMPAGGTISIRTSNTMLPTDVAGLVLQAPPGEYATISVRDTGTGIAPGLQSRIFEPFFTTKEPGRGTGLGLSMVYGIVKQCGGALALNTEPGSGSTFHLHLPRAGEPAPPLPAEREGSAPASCTGTILLVEDEPAVLELSAGGLRARGYTVLCAATGEEARALAARHPCAIDLLVCDLVLPKTNGADVAQAVQATRPDLRTLFISGYADSRIVRGLCEQDGFELLPKPFTPAQLVERVQKLLAGERTRSEPSPL
jgi:two-component system cell cycle sensor histidine kinase/response regulator CckA